MRAGARIYWYLDSISRRVGAGEACSVFINGSRVGVSEDFRDTFRTSLRNIRGVLDVN